MKKLGHMCLWSVLSVWLVLGMSSYSYGIQCQEARQLIGYFLKIHYSIHDVDEDLSKKVLINYIKAWDPSKVYFLQSDVDALTQTYSLSLRDDISRGDCKSVEGVYAVYAKRFQERQLTLQGLIDLKHDFTVDEFINIDRKTLAYGKTTQETEDRWRQRIKFQHMQLTNTHKDEKAIREKIKKMYELADKRQKEMSSNDVYDIFLDAFATSLDPHTDYLSPNQQEDFRISTRLSLEGIGALLRSDEGITTISSLMPGGAAAKSGLLKVDDKIVAVSQGEDGHMVDVIDMDLRDVVKLIRGPGGTVVRLTIRRDGKELIIPIVREKLQLQDSAAKSKLLRLQVQDADKNQAFYKIGVIDLPTFYLDFEGRQSKQEDFRSSSKDVALEILKLKKQGIDLLIVDLRGNLGGALDEAVSGAGLFNGPGPVVQTKGAKAKPTSNSFDGPPLYNGPMMLVIDKQSASSSEILAGALKDYERALIIGDKKTFGKGTVQVLNDLDPTLGAIKVTISKFYTPDGSSTQIKGVASDIHLPSILEHYEIGEDVFDYALPWEQVQPLPHKRFGLVKPYVSSLQAASEARVRMDAGFKKLQEAIETYESKKDSRLRVSLKEQLPEEKAKEAREQKEFETKVKRQEKGDHIAVLTDDFYFQEIIRVGADYVSLLQGKSLTSEVRFLDIEERLLSLTTPALLLPRYLLGIPVTFPSFFQSPPLQNKWVQPPMLPLGW